MTNEQTIAAFKDKLLSLNIAQALVHEQISPDGGKTINMPVYADNFVETFKEIEAYFLKSLQDATERGRNEAVDFVMNNVHPKFWEDQDHAEGGYISKRELKKLLDSARKSIIK